MYRDVRFKADLSRKKREFFKLETTQELMKNHTTTFVNATATDYAFDKVYADLEKKATGK